MTGRRALLCLGTAFALLWAQEGFAQYHTYSSGKPSVEVDLGALDALPAKPRSYDSRTYSTVPHAAPVTQAPLPLKAPEPPAAADPFGGIIAEEAKAPVPQAAPEAPRKRLLKPVFTARPAEPPRAAPAPVSAAAQTPVAKPAPAAPVPVSAPAPKIAPKISAPPAQRLPEPEYAPRIIEDTNIIDDDDAGLTVEEAATAPPADEEETVLEEAVSVALPVVPSLSDLTLPFDGSESTLNAQQQQKLDAIAAEMETGGNRLQVRAYATGEDGTTSSARRIALSRALAVRSYLMDKGIKPARVDVRALGADTDKSPVDRVDLIFAR